MKSSTASPFPAPIVARAQLAARIEQWLAMHPEPDPEQCIACGLFIECGCEEEES